MAGMRGFQKFLGTPITPGKYWLDIDFPDGPPPEYERSGYGYFTCDACTNANLKSDLKSRMIMWHGLQDRYTR